jgi:hypothetical protein
MGGGGLGEVSPDGKWYWDGHSWLSTVSPDGKFRWDGTSWVPVSARPAAAGSWVAAHPLRVAAIGGGALAAFLIIAMIIGAAVSAGSTPSGRTQLVTAQLQTPTPSNDSSPTPTVAQLASPSPTPSPSPRPSPSASPSPSLTPVAAAPAPPPPAPPPAQNTCGAPSNPWGYNFCGGNLIYSPPGSFCQYFNCIPSFWKSTNGYVDECKDGTYSHSGGRQGACSYHGGEWRPLYGP